MAPNEIARLSKRIAMLEANRPEPTAPDPFPAWMEDHAADVLAILDDIAESEGTAMDDVPDDWSERIPPYAYLEVVTMLSYWHRRQCETFEAAIKVARGVVLSGPCRPTDALLARLWPDRDSGQHDEWTLRVNVALLPHDDFRTEPDLVTIGAWRRELERRRTPSPGIEDLHAIPC